MVMTLVFNTDHQARHSTIIHHKWPRLLYNAAFPSNDVGTMETDCSGNWRTGLNQQTWISWSTFECKSLRILFLGSMERDSCTDQPGEETDVAAVLEPLISASCRARAWVRENLEAVATPVDEQINCNVGRYFLRGQKNVLWWILRY